MWEVKKIVQETSAREEISLRDMVDSLLYSGGFNHIFAVYQQKEFMQQSDAHLMQHDRC